MTRCAAVGWWNPDAVIVGAAAARLTFWPELPVRQIDVAGRGPVPIGRGYRFHRRTINPWHVIEWDGLRVTRPAATAMELVTEMDGDPIDTCLRSRKALLPDLWEAYRAYPARPATTPGTGCSSTLATGHGLRRSAWRKGSCVARA
ncbi:MAG: hypothetical protein ACOH16_09240 [Propionibacteriaceae bacterium]